MMLHTDDLPPDIPALRRLFEASDILVSDEIRDQLECLYGDIPEWDPEEEDEEEDEEELLLWSSRWSR